MLLADKVAIITGASTGIGAASAREGASVVLSARGGQARRPGRGLRLDVAFNNAGIGPEGIPLADGTPRSWEATLATNLTGVAQCMRHEIRAMLSSGGGAIVNNASTAAFFGTAFAAAYSASKHGLVGLTKTAAAEYGSAGIRVNVVNPGVTETPQATPLNHRHRPTQQDRTPPPTSHHHLTDQH